MIRPHGREGRQFLPIARPNIQLPTAFNVLSDGSRYRDHNIAGQQTVHIILEDKNGNKMRLHSTQQVLNLVNNTKNWFHVHDGGSNNHRHNRRFKHVK